MEALWSLLLIYFIWKHHVSFNRSPPTGPRSRAPCLSVRARLALRMLSFDLGLPSPGQQQQRISWRCSVRQLSLIMLLMALMWFVRLYLHYCSQWLYLQAIAVPVNKWVCFLWYRPAHTDTRAHTCAHIRTHPYTHQTQSVWNHMQKAESRTGCT